RPSYQDDSSSSFQISCIAISVNEIPRVKLQLSRVTENAPTALLPPPPWPIAVLLVPHHPAHLAERHAQTKIFVCASARARRRSPTTSHGHFPALDRRSFPQTPGPRTS